MIKAENKTIILWSFLPDTFMCHKLRESFPALGDMTNRMTLFSPRREPRRHRPPQLPVSLLELQQLLKLIDLFNSFLVGNFIEQISWY